MPDGDFVQLPGFYGRKIDVTWAACDGKPGQQVATALAALQRSLAAAKAGTKLLLVPLFDGTSADGAQDTTTVISAWTPPAAGKFPDLAKLGSARMRVAFFDRNATGGAAGGASAPDYEVGLRYFENGVADDLKMDFGEFSVDGKMQELALLPNPC